jgi:site-specific DNA-methyltransferase (adenine-specific)
MNVHFSSATDDWATPQNLFDQLNSKYGFTLDAAASHTNRKVEQYFTKEDDALAKDWPGVVWLNPPYGREIGKFMAKAYKESQKGSTVVCLVPARTDTAWWHDYAMKGEIEFLRGRLKFGNAKNAAPFPSAIVVFK